MKYLCLFVPFLLLLSCSSNNNNVYPLEPTLGKYVYLDSANVLHVIKECVSINGTGVNYPQAKDLWASDFTEECPFKRLGLLSSPSV